MASTSKPPSASATSHDAAPVAHPFEGSDSLIEVLPDIDVEEEVRMYEDMCDVSSGVPEGFLTTDRRSEPCHRERAVP